MFKPNLLTEALARHSSAPRKLYIGDTSTLPVHPTLQHEHRSPRRPLLLSETSTEEAELRSVEAHQGEEPSKSLIFGGSSSLPGRSQRFSSAEPW